MLIFCYQKWSLAFVNVKVSFVIASNCYHSFSVYTASIRLKNFFFCHFDIFETKQLQKLNWRQVWVTLNRIWEKEEKAGYTAGQSRTLGRSGKAKMLRGTNGPKDRPTQHIPVKVFLQDTPSYVNIHLNNVAHVQYSEKVTSGQTNQQTDQQQGLGSSYATNKVLIYIDAFSFMM